MYSIHHVIVTIKYQELLQGRGSDEEKSRSSMHDAPVL